MQMEVRAGELTLPGCGEIYEQPAACASAHDRARVIAAANALVDANRRTVGDAAYGINTGFRIAGADPHTDEKLELLQRNLLLSHAAGRRRGAAGCRRAADSCAQDQRAGARILRHQHSALIDALLALLAHEVYPVIPGARLGGRIRRSGAPRALERCCSVIGQVRVNGGRCLPAAEGLRRCGPRARIKLRPKEGLALINGTQVSTALALAGLFGAEDVFAAAVVAGAMSVDALKGSDAPFDDRIHQSAASPGRSSRGTSEYRD
jgi:histidine ammonia-lyase